jgi:AraC-like DNA-binding protein
MLTLARARKPLACGSRQECCPNTTAALWFAFVRVTKAIVSLVGFATTAGIQPPELLRAAKLDASLFAGPDTHLLHSQEQRLWAEAARLTGDPDFGLHLAEWLAPRSSEIFDVLSFALRSCATLGDHYRLACRAVRLIHSDISLSVEEGLEVATLVHGHPRESSEPPRHSVEGFLSLALLSGREAIGEDFAPRSVHFRHARPARVSEHERIFRSPVHFGCPRNELVLDRAILARAQRNPEPRLLAMLNRQLDELLAKQPESHRFLDTVRQSMMDEMPSRAPSISAVAAKQHMSPRTLQRRLHVEGVSFATLLSDLRRDLALRYLRDQRIAIGEVGFLLGFQDVTAFYRAFKQWTGTTPANYRRATPPH